MSINKSAANKMPATNYKDATSKTDLENILKQCSNCYNSTHNGDFILSHSDLPSILFKNYRKLPVYNFIVNSLDEHDSISGPVVGHWVNIIILRQAGRFCHALICDSLGEVTNNPTVMQNIEKFCTNNSLRKHHLSGKYQIASSSRCGYLCTAIIAYIHGKTKLSDVYRLQKLFLRSSVMTNENLMLKIYRKHFT